MSKAESEFKTMHKGFIGGNKDLEPLEEEPEEPYDVPYTLNEPTFIPPKKPQTRPTSNTRPN